MSAKFVHCMKQ